jgi:cytochrome c biogenesis protein CcmG/thiol:disulfide interchange protein DsbE
MAVPPLSDLHNDRAAQPPLRRWRPLFLLPVIGFLGLVAAFALGLRHDPSLVPSPLLGKLVPVFELPPVAAGGPGLSSADLKGRVYLVNVFASWCVACREEHPLLMQIARSGLVLIAGLDYKDKPADAVHWLAANGNPYDRTGADILGRAAIDWGVYGVPETFVVDPRGIIVDKEIGPITPEILERKIVPVIAQLRKPLAPSDSGR